MRLSWNQLVPNLALLPNLAVTKMAVPNLALKKRSNPKSLPKMAVVPNLAVTKMAPKRPNWPNLIST
jgi:hypothetical protein